MEVSCLSPENINTTTAPQTTNTTAAATNRMDCITSITPDSIDFPALSLTNIHHQQNLLPSQTITLISPR
jgi:hypothetical protein